MTTTELIDGLIRFAIAFITPICAASVGWNKYQEGKTERKRLETQKEEVVAKENSAGVTAIADLVQKIVQINGELRKIEGSVKELDKETQQQFKAMRDDIQEFTMKAITLLSGKN